MKSEVNVLRINAKSIMWGVIYLLLLLSIMIPPISIVTIHLFMVPLVVLYVLLEPRGYILLMIPLLLIAFVLLGPFGSVVVGLTLFFMVPSVAMGHLYKRNTSAGTVITAGVVVLLGELLLALIIASLLGASPRSIIASIAQDSIANVQSLFPEQFANVTADDIAGMMTQLLPLYMIIFSLYYIWVTHGISRFSLRRSGVTVPGLRPVKDWMLPKAVVWYYLVALLLDFFVRKDGHSTISMVLLNSIPLFMFIFGIQAIAFFFFLADHKGWSRLLPIAMVLPVFLFPPLSIIGVLDVAFPIRKGITKQGL